MWAIGMQRIGLSLETAEERYILARDVNLLGLTRQKVFGLAGNVPAVGVGGQTFTYIFFGGIVISFHPDGQVPENCVVDGIEDHHTSS